MKDSLLDDNNKEYVIAFAKSFLDMDIKKEGDHSYIVINIFNKLKSLDYIKVLKRLGDKFHDNT